MKVLCTESSAETVKGEIPDVALRVGDLPELAVPVVLVARDVGACAVMLHYLDKVAVGVLCEVFHLAVRIGHGELPVVVGVRGHADVRVNRLYSLKRIVRITEKKRAGSRRTR